MRHDSVQDRERLAAQYPELPVSTTSELVQKGDRVPVEGVLDLFIRHTGASRN